MGGCDEGKGVGRVELGERVVRDGGDKWGGLGMLVEMEEEVERGEEG